VRCIAAALALVACRGDHAPASSGSGSAATASASPRSIGLPAGVDDLAPLLEPVRTAHAIPALGAAVWRGDALVAIGATGVRAVGHDARVTVDDRWHLGSDTKAMTAVLIGIYVDRGVLHWTDTLGELFPGTDPGYAKVTLDQLLQHRAGLPANDPATRTELAKPGPDHGRAAFAKLVLSRPPAHAPGTFEYSNTGYILAATALEARIGNTWDVLLRDEVWTPLHMTSCGFGAPGTARVDQPWGHIASTAPAPGGDPWQNVTTRTAISPATPESDNAVGLGPAGTAHCSLADWGKFLAFVMHGARHDKTALLSAAAFDHLLTPAGEYMAGWMFVDRPWAGGRALTHAGSNTMWFANAWIAPEKQVAFVVVENIHDEAAGELVLGAILPRYVTSQ
jgi:CubicO group peptidase (beta-lactamase class C family)